MCVASIKKKRICRYGAAVTHPVEYRQKRLTQNVALHFVGQVRCARVCTRVCLSDC